MLGIEERDRVIDALNRNGADENVFCLEAKNHRRNLGRDHFYGWHARLDDHHEELGETIEHVAGRIHAVGGFTLGRMQEFPHHVRLRESPGRTEDAPKMFIALLDDAEAIIRRLREVIETCRRPHDEGTMDLLVKTLQIHERMAWENRAILAT